MAVAAFAGVLGMATPSLAADVFVVSATPTDTSQFGTTAEDLSGLYPNRVYSGVTIFGMSPLQVHGINKPGESTFDTLAFCLDFGTDMHDDGWTDDGLFMVNYNYHDGSLADANLGTDPDAETKIQTLINYGTNLYAFHFGDSLTQIRLAAIQGAIWQIQTGLHFQFSEYGSANPALYNGLIQQFVNLDGVPAGLSQSEIKVLFSDDGNSQAIAFAMRSAVPEPTVWGFMIVGFFGAGSLLRRSRRHAFAG